jgi:hypothetical protein
MFAKLTKSRSANYYRQSMLKLTLTALLLWLFWAPLAPVRNVTATVLHTTANLIESN